MKIIICTQEYPPKFSSGIGNVAYNVAENLKKMGHECIICAPDMDISLGNVGNIQKYGIIGLIQYWQQVGKYLKNHDYDVAWLHNPLLLNDVPLNAIATVHTTYYGQYISGKKPWAYYFLSCKLENFCYKNNRDMKMTSICKEVTDELEKIGINKKNVTYIPNGVDINRFYPGSDKTLLRKKFGIPEDHIVFLSVGRLIQEKEPLKLIKVFSLINKNNKNTSLVIAGTGPLLKEIQSYIKSNNIENVIFLGHIQYEDVHDLYRCSNYYIMSSSYEGQPLTLLEAMASALPCIVSRIPNLKIVEEAKCGIAIDFNDIEKSSDKINDFIREDPRQYSLNARKYSVELLDWRIIAKEYEGTFEALRAETNKLEKAGPIMTK